MAQYQIENKIYMKKKGKCGKLNLLFNVLIVLLLLVSLLEVYAGGKSWSEEWKTLVLPAILAVYAKMKLKSAENGYVPLALHLTVQSGEVILDYPSIDRNDGGGARHEIITLKTPDIEEIMYSGQLKSIRIVGKGLLDVTYFKEHRQTIIDQRDDGRSSEYIIYLSESQCGAVLEDMESSLGLEIKHVD